ncbi:MAG TPA: hypothetical protein VGX03_15520 [Candidatus Binatia bacterium]|jgi:hypothetical protein|nr:hypothetical protein [Candidatus Binatia bacterium]
MSHGHLDGKIAAYDFWPSCENCWLYEACKIRPRHAAYPHTWHWGKEFAAFADGYLILRSWVGTVAIGQPHTGCKSYKVDPRYVSKPQAHHRLYLELEHEKEQLESEMAALERKKVWTRNNEDFQASLFNRYRQILEKQAELRTVVVDVQPLAAAVNE